MYSVQEYWLAPVGFPIRISPDQSLVADSPKLFAGSNVLHRLQLPRHPPYALIRLTIYQNNRFTTQPQILRSVPRSDYTSQHLTPDITLDLPHVCVPHTYNYRSQTHHTPVISLSHFYLVKELSRRKAQTKTTPQGRLCLFSLSPLTGSPPSPLSGQGWWS